MDSQFTSSFVLQHVRLVVTKSYTAMGPKNACSHADLAMGIIDEKAKFEGSLRPILWWRYRDDIFDLWTQGLPKLLEFTDYINDLYPTIKFELVYSENHLNFLDLTLHFCNRFISTDVYANGSWFIYFTLFT